MALTAKQKERLDKLDFQMGGGFSDFLTDRRKLEPSDSKFLFVGLGGRGTDTVAKIRTEVYKRIQCNENTKKPDNFEFLAIDTDVNHLNDLARGGFGEIGLSADPANSEVCQLYDKTAAGVLAPGKKHLIPDHISEWLNPMMQASLTGAGANGIRQAGRFLLFGTSAFAKLESALSSKLGRLHSLITNPEAQKMIVYVFAGVGGGTGSGTVVDMPYIIREICRRNAWDVRIYGYVFLPDTYPENARGAHLRYNSYAALKEIDALMNIGSMDGVGRFKATYNSGFSVNSTDNIFDSCVLVSGKKTDGLVPNPEKYSVRVVVDNIINLIVDNSTNEGFLANSFLDNSPTEISNAVVAMPEKIAPRNANYCYIVIGTGALVLPMEQILAYISQGTMNMLRAGWDKHPQDKDVTNMPAMNAMLPQNQADYIIDNSTVPLMKYTRGIGGQATKKDVINDALFNTLNAYHRSYFVKLDDAWAEAKNKNLEEIAKLLDTYYNKKFSDPEGGIFFLKELISDRVMDNRPINGILHRLRTYYMESIEGFINGEKSARAELEEEMREIKAELDSPLCVLPSGKIEQYREKCIQWLASGDREYVYNTIVRDCMWQIIKWFEKKDAELQVYIDTFIYMADVVHRNYRCAIEGRMPAAEYAGHLLDFSKTEDEATQKVVSYLDSMLNVKTPEGLVSALEEKLVREENQWFLSEEEFNPMLVFVRFLEQQYMALPQLTMEKFLELKYGTDGIQLGMQAVCDELRHKAAFVFPTRSGFDLASLARHQYIVMPATTVGPMGPALTGYAAANRAAVASSVDMNSLFWYNLAVGVPLFALLDIEEYEKMYEDNKVVGMHVRDNANENWKDMPALMNRKLWLQANFNERERKLEDGIVAKTAEMKESGFIFYEEGDALYKAYCMPNDAAVTEKGILAWVQSYLDDEENAAITDDGYFDDGAAFVQKLVSENDFEKKLIGYNTYAPVTEENLGEMVRENYFLMHELEKVYGIYQTCRQMIAEKNSAGLEASKRRKDMERFYDYSRLGIIQFKEDQVILVMPDGEEREVMYFEDFTSLENEHVVYYAYKEFYERYDEADLELLDEHKADLAKDRSDDVRAKNRERSAAFIELCTKSNERLKKIDAQRTLKQAGMGDMIPLYREFYEDMIRLKKG